MATRRELKAAIGERYREAVGRERRQVLDEFIGRPPPTAASAPGAPPRRRSAASSWWPDHERPMQHPQRVFAVIARYPAVLGSFGEQAL
jgi:hypothetical protein